jgi:DNA-binding CsgD family transcriptional regulator
MCYLSPRIKCHLSPRIEPGKTNPEIAIILGASSRTIDKHMERILDRLGVENRAGLMLATAEHLRPHR